jgi:hypothetical protein
LWGKKSTWFCLMGTCLCCWDQKVLAFTTQIDILSLSLKN